MATTHTISRRKPTTYGKASSKPLRDQFSSSAFDPSAPNVDMLAPRSGTAPSKPRNIGSRILPPHERGHMSQQAIPADEPQEPRASFYHSQSHVDHDSVESTVEEHRTEWEISSPDAGQTSARSGSTWSMKRRRITPRKLGDIANKKIPQPVRLFDDDGSLSPIVASNDHADLNDCLALRPSSSQALTENLYPSSLGASTESESRISKPSPFQARRASNSHTALVPRGKVTLKASAFASHVWTAPMAPAASLEASKEQCCNSRRKSVAVPTLGDSRQAKSPSAPTLRTPARPVRSVESTTPHQRALWDMLLPESHESSSPVNYKEPEVEDRCFMDHVRTSFESAEAFSKGRQPRRKASRRRRIIDRLQPVQPKQQDSVKSPHSIEMLSDSVCEDSTMSGIILPSELETSPISPKDQRSDTLIPDDTTSPIAGHHRPLPSTGLKITYSSQRSHLANEYLDDISSFDLLPLTGGAAQTGATPEKRARKKAPAVVPATAEDPGTAEVGCSQNSSMRTIHELRESGENVRQMNDLETLFDDLDGSGPIPISLRRSKLLELVRRLQEPASCRLVLDQGYDRRLLAMSASRDPDAMIDTLYATAMLYLVAAPFTVRATSQSNGPRTAELFATRLTDEQDLTSIAQSRRSNMSKRSQSDLKECVDIILHSNIWRSGAPAILSGRMIGLQGLEYLVRKWREAGYKNGKARAVVTNRLGGEPLQQLFDAVEEFLQYHRQIDEVPETREGETDLKASFIGRLESVLTRLRDVV
ncbi:MAG: hypothetical protein Q9216_000456 [Gyalolechia sp. 2 TL-2023]